MFVHLGGSLWRSHGSLIIRVSAEKKRWPHVSLANWQMLTQIVATPSRKKKTFTVWPKPTKRSLTTIGKIEIRLNFNLCLSKTFEKSKVFFLSFTCRRGLCQPPVAAANS